MADTAGLAAEPHTGADVVVAYLSSEKIPTGTRWLFLCTMIGTAGFDTGVEVAVAYFGTRATLDGICWLFLRTKTGFAVFVALGYIGADADSDTGRSYTAGDGLGVSAGPAISVGLACSADSAPDFGIGTDNCLAIGTDPASDVLQSCAPMMAVVPARLATDLSITEEYDL